MPGAYANLPRRMFLFARLYMVTQRAGMLWSEVLNTPVWLLGVRFGADGYDHFPDDEGEPRHPWDDPVPSSPEDAAVASPEQMGFFTKLWDEQRARRGT